MKRIKIGTVAGRHEMPVHLYLLPGPVEPGQPAYDAAYLAARQVGTELEWVDLYFTGLTEATLGAIDGLHAALVPIVLLWRWDAAAAEYQCLARRDPERQPDWPSDIALEEWLDRERRLGPLGQDRVEELLDELGGVIHFP